MSFSFTPSKRSGMDMPRLSSLKKAYRFGREVNQNFGSDVRESGRYLKQAFKGLKRKTAQHPKRSIAPAPKVSMSNGSGQMSTMGKRVHRPRPTKPLKKRVAQLEKKVRQNYSTLIFKADASLTISSLANRCGYAEGTFMSPSQIEDVINALPILNTAAPGTKATIDVTGITTPTKWTFKAHAKAIMRNNYLYPVNVRCYVLKPKIDQNISVETSITAGMTDMASGSGIYSTTATSTYPSDSKEFTDTWTIVNSCDMKLQSGDECVVPYQESFVYDQEYRDNNSESYLRKYTRLIFFRVVGVVAHDQAVTTNIGIAPTALDCIIYRKIELKYPDIAPLKSLEVTGGLSTLTTAVVGIASAEVETGL